MKSMTSLLVFSALALQSTSALALTCDEAISEFNSYVASTPNGIGNETKLLKLGITAIDTCELAAFANSTPSLQNLLVDAHLECRKAKKSDVSLAFCYGKIAELAKVFIGDN